MTYLAFHLLFILPPLVVLLRWVPRVAGHAGSRAWWTLPAVAAIALIYTTPWDNYLVYRGVWWYGPDRVLGTIGYVPVEEYLFFVLQPLLTGAWAYRVLLRDGAFAHAGAALAERGRAAGHTAAGGVVLHSFFVLVPSGSRALGVTLYVLAAAAGGLALTFPAGLYLGLILAWAAPVLAAQWYFVAGAVARRARAFAVAVAVPTLYLWFADRVAIGLGIWSIAPEHTTGLHLVGLPVEEALFFLVTNLLVVQGVLLFLGPRLAATPAAAS
jgi:lycopene beta-cyclase